MFKKLSLKILSVSLSMGIIAGIGAPGIHAGLIDKLLKTKANSEIKDEDKNKYYSSILEKEFKKFIERDPKVFKVDAEFAKTVDPLAMAITMVKLNSILDKYKVFTDMLIEFHKKHNTNFTLAYFSNVRNSYAVSAEVDPYLINGIYFSPVLYKSFNYYDRINTVCHEMGHIFESLMFYMDYKKENIDNLLKNKVLINRIDFLEKEYRLFKEKNNVDELEMDIENYESNVKIDKYNINNLNQTISMLMSENYEKDHIDRIQSELNDEEKNLVLDQAELDLAKKKLDPLKYEMKKMREKIKLLNDEKYKLDNSFYDSEKIYKEDENKYVEAIKSRIIEISKEKYGNENTKISDYGETNSAEWFAECFADLETGKKLNKKLALATKYILNGYSKKISKQKI